MTFFSRLRIRSKLALVVTLLFAAVSVAIFLYFPAKMRRQAIDAVAQKATAITEMEALSVASGLAGHDRVAENAAVAEAVARKVLMMTAVLLLANELGLRTIAEGVETEEQAAFVRTRGCAELQGFLISRPLPAVPFQKGFMQPRPVEESTTVE